MQLAALRAVGRLMPRPAAAAAAAGRQAAASLRRPAERDPVEHRALPALGALPGPSLLAHQAAGGLVTQQAGLPQCPASSTSTDQPLGRIGIRCAEEHGVGTTNWLWGGPASPAGCLHTRTATKPQAASSGPVKTQVRCLCFPLTPTGDCPLIAANMHCHWLARSASSSSGISTQVEAQSSTPPWAARRHHRCEP